MLVGLVILLWAALGTGTTTRIDIGSNGNVSLRGGLCVGENMGVKTSVTAGVGAVSGFNITMGVSTEKRTEACIGTSFNRRRNVEGSVSVPMPVSVSTGMRAGVTLVADVGARSEATANKNRTAGMRTK